MQGAQVWSLGWEDPTCCRATKPVHHNYWACTLEPARHNYWARAPQLLKPTHSRARKSQLLSPHAATTEARMPRACALQRETTAMRSPRATTKSSPHSPQLEKACTQQWRPNAAKNNKIKLNLKKKRNVKELFKVIPLPETHTEVQLMNTFCC